jgi:hypothetical protein
MRYLIKLIQIGEAMMKKNYFLKPFHSLFINASRASEVILRGKARELRTTAIINLMKSGFLDQ